MYLLSFNQADDRWLDVLAKINIDVKNKTKLSVFKIAFQMARPSYDVLNKITNKSFS